MNSKRHLKELSWILRLQWSSKTLPKFDLLSLKFRKTNFIPAQEVKYIPEKMKTGTRLSLPYELSRTAAGLKNKALLWRLSDVLGKILKGFDLWLKGS